MSFSLAFAPDAKSQWQALDIQLQEIVLDELDKLTLVKAHIGGVIRHNFQYERSGARHYFVLRLAVDLPTRVMTVVGIHHHDASSN